VATPPSRQFWIAFTPKLITAWREGQVRKFWRNDILAGLTVAIVALPLAMALGIARVDTAVLTAGLPGISRVIAKFVFLNPHRRLGK
jgi:MFS superfamily sulfate permease-like transporter